MQNLIKFSTQRTRSISAEWVRYLRFRDSESYWLSNFLIVRSWIISQKSFHLTKALLILDIIIFISLAVHVGSESCLRIGYPSRQDGPIFRAHDFPLWSHARKKNCLRQTHRVCYFWTIKDRRQLLKTVKKNSRIYNAQCHNYIRHCFISTTNNNLSETFFNLAKGELEGSEQGGFKV